MPGFFIATIVRHLSKMSPMCPKICIGFAHDGGFERAERTRLPSRSGARAGLVREVPAARRAAGPEDRSGPLGLTGATAGGLLHEADCRRLAAGRLRPGATRHAARPGPHGRDIRRRRDRIPALRRARPGPQAVDAARLPLDDPGAPAPGVRADARRGHRRCDHRALARSASIDAVTAHEEQAADPASRGLPSGAEGVRAPEEPDGGHRAPPPAPERRHRGIQRSKRSSRWCGRRSRSRTRRST